MFLRKKRSSSVARRTTSLTNRLASTRGRRLGFEPLEDRNLLSVTWCGGHGTNWTTGANWVGGVAPTAGADLVFSGANTATYDDFVDGTSFRSIELASNNFSLAGNRAQLTSNITVDNNVTGSTISMTVQPTSASPLSINLNGAGSGLTISGVLFSGSGGITKSGAGTLTLSGVNNYGGPTKITGGTLVLGNASAMQSSTLDYNSYGGTLSFGTLTAATLGALQGNQTLPLTNNNSAGVTLTVGGLNGTITYGGVLSGAGSLVKSGSGTLTLTAASTYGGSTTVQNGTLAVGVDNALPQTTTVTLGYNALSGVLQLGDATTGYDQTLAGLYTAGTGVTNCVTTNGGDYPMLTLNIASGTDTYGGVLGDLAGWGAYFSIAKTGAGTLSLTNTSATYPNDYCGNTTITGGTLTFSSGALGWSYCVIADGGTLQWASGNTQDITASCTFYIMPGKTAILDTNGNDVTLAGSIAQGDTATIGLTKTGAGKLTFTNQAVYAGNMTLSQGTLDVGGSDPQTGAARADTISAASLTLTSGSTYKAELTDAACGQIDVTGKVALGSATLSVNNTGTTNTYGVVRVLIRNGGADPVVGTFSGLGEGAQVTAGGVPYFITYRYNAEAGTFANGNDVAICSALVDVPAVPAAPALVASAHYDTIDDNFKDAARHLETSTTAKYITQYQLPDVSTLLYNSAYFAHPGGSTWPDNTEYVRYSSEDPTIATVNATSGLVTFVTPGTARILVTAYQGGTNTTSYKTNLEMRLTGAYTGGDTTTVVARYTPNTLVITNNLLVLYNADVPASVDLLNYYLTNRYGLTGTALQNFITSNTLGITGLGPYLSNFNHDVTATGSTSLINQVMTWIQNNPTKPIRYIVALSGLPSRRGDDGGTSLSYHLRNDSRWGANLPAYTGADQFTVAEYGAPLVSFLDCDNTPNLMAYWRFDENTGGLAYDAAAACGIADTGTLVNNPTWQSYGNSEIGNSLSFNGINQYVSVPNSTDVKVGATKSITVACWAKSSDANSWGNSTPAGFVNEEGSFAMYGDSGGGVWFQVWDGAAWHWLQVLRSSIPTGINTWNHFAGTASYDGAVTHLTLYINGVAMATGIFTGYIRSSTNPLYLGSMSPSYSFLKGSLDEVRIYNTALSGNLIGAPPGGDIAELYFQGPSGTVSHLSTLDGQGQQTSLSPASYSVQPLTLANGAVQYGDAAITYTSIPSQYLGCTVVKTANADNANANLALCFDYNSMTDVYVLIDNLITNKPSWLTTLGFTATSDTVTNSAGHSFTVYSAFAAVNGVCGLHLGANNGTGGSEMYSVWAKPRPTGVPFWLSPGSCGLQNFGLKGGNVVSQYVAGSPATLSSVPNKYLGATLIQTSNADNQNANYSMSFWLSTGSIVYVLHDNLITSKPDWLVQQYTPTGDIVTNSDGHTFTVYWCAFASNPPTFGPNNGNASSEMYSVLVMPLDWNAVRNCTSPPMDHGMLLPSSVSGYANTKAFIDKEKAAANSGGLQADGVTINGTAAGVVGTNSKWILDDTPDSSYGPVFSGWRDPIRAEGVSESNIAYADNGGAGPNLSSNEPGSTPLEPTAYESKGAHCNGYPLLGSDWANPFYFTDPHVVFTGKANWWIGSSWESYDGVYNDWCFTDPVDAFAPDAFGAGKNAPAGGNSARYANTPVCWVGNTIENCTGGAESARYLSLWAHGWSSLEAGWASQGGPVAALIVTDIGLVRSAPSLSTTASSSSQIDLSWSDLPSGVTSIKVYRAPDVGGHAGTFALINTLGPTARTYSDPGRTDGTRYWYYVEAYINPTTSQYSNYNGATTPLLAPTALTATAVSSSEIDLNWTNNSASATDYLIERSTDNGTYWSQIFDSTPASVHAYNNYSLSAGTGYWYRVRAYNSAAGIYSTYVASASAATWLSVPSSLVGYWRFDENGSATAYDTATAGSTADNVTLSSASWQNQNASKLGNSLNFNGNGYLYTAANPADLNITGQLTLACWAKSGSSGNWSGSGSGSGIGTFFSKGSAYSLGASSSSGTTVQFQATIAGTSRSVSYPATGIDSWHYYTGTYDGTNLRLYVDGVLRATSPSYTGAIASNTSAAWMGNTLYGSLDEMRVYNTVISQNDITALGGQGYTSVKYLTVANSLAAAFYHEQDYAFGATNVYQYGDRQSTFSLPAQYRGSTLIQTANADNQSTTFSMSFATSAPCAVYVLYDNAITSPASWLTQQFTSTGQTVVNSDGHTFTIYKSIRAAGKIYLGANGGNVNSQMYTVLLMPLCWNGTDNKVS